MSKIPCFTSKAVQLSKNAIGGRGEVAAPDGRDGFADYAVVSLHCLRVYLEKSYREALDLLSKMPHILEEIGLKPADLLDHSTLVKCLTGSRQHFGECCCACRRICTARADTLPSMQRF
jgi:IS5 family transposase